MPKANPSGIILRWFSLFWVSSEQCFESGSVRIRTILVGSGSGRLGPDLDQNPDPGLNKWIYLKFLVCVKAINTSSRKFSRWKLAENLFWSGSGSRSGRFQKFSKVQIRSKIARICNIVSGYNWFSYVTSWKRTMWFKNPVRYLRINFCTTFFASGNFLCTLKFVQNVQGIAATWMWHNQKGGVIRFHRIGWLETIPLHIFPFARIDTKFYHSRNFICDAKFREMLMTVRQNFKCQNSFSYSSFDEFVR
jgi:hypothetical protein